MEVVVRAEEAVARAVEVAVRAGEAAAGLVGVAAGLVGVAAGLVGEPPPPLSLLSLLVLEFRVAASLLGQLKWTYWTLDLMLG
jgi:hypothetical protein